MINTTNNKLSYPELFFDMSENKIMLNILDMSEFAEQQACRRESSEENIHYMFTLGKIERQRYEAENQ